MLGKLSGALLDQELLLGKDHAGLISFSTRRRGQGSPGASKLPIAAMYAMRFMEARAMASQNVANGKPGRAVMSSEFTDILYSQDKGVATITINRPKVLNAFRAHTVEEL